ncbi:hypothetical protein PIROE2DRAFT_60677 [Piromyces sp. E2]|nr:hypothetical protein PIROE2DRAFT_60677 [Piromyces sp. E2]|eukprot:OUM64403.1 hypothetical protein PIROE2DRAFT_60677 [Piromyces sp. E2]
MTTSAYKISSKPEPITNKKNSNTHEEKVKTGVYKKHKDSGSNGRLSSFKSNITNKKSNKSKFVKRDDYDNCYYLSSIIESYATSNDFISYKNLCSSSNLSEYLKNLRKYQECYPEDPLGYALETDIFSFCMVDDKGNLCPMARQINRNENFVLSPSIENYKMNCKFEKCRLQSIHLNKIHRESYGEEITFMDNEEFDKVEEYLNSSECLAMTME